MNEVRKSIQSLDKKFSKKLRFRKQTKGNLGNEKLNKLNKKLNGKHYQ
jgi:hypothetical protein